MRELLGYPLGYIMKFIYDIASNYGTALLIFVLLYKLAMFPFAYKRNIYKNQRIYMRKVNNEINTKYRLYPKKRKLYLSNYKKRCCFSSVSSLDTFITIPFLYGLWDVIYKPLTHIYHIPKDVIQELINYTSSIAELSPLYSSRPEIALIIDIKDNPAMYSNYSNIVNQISNFNNTIFGGLIDLSEIPTLKIDEILAGNYAILIPILVLFVDFLNTIISLIILKKNDIESYNKSKSLSISTLMLICISEWISLSFPVALGMYMLISMSFNCIQSVVLYKHININNIEKHIDKMKFKRGIDDAKYPIDDSMCSGEQLIDEECITFEEKTELTDYQRKRITEIHNQYLGKFLV